MRARPVEPADLGRLPWFRCATGTSWTRIVERMVRRELADVLADPTRRVEALVVGGEPILGVAAVEPVEGVEGIWAVRLVAVERSHQRQGIGRVLMAEALEVCRARGATRAVFEAHRRNHAAIRMTESLGAAWTVDPEDPGFLLGVVDLG